MKIKFNLDTEKAAKATVAIAASYGLGRVLEGTNYPQLAFANMIALIPSLPSLQSCTAPAWHQKQSKPT
jgi:hypothetical protein